MSKVRISIMCVLLSFVVSQIAAMQEVSKKDVTNQVQMIINDDAQSKVKLDVLEAACENIGVSSVSGVLLDLTLSKAVDSEKFQALMKACQENTNKYPNLSKSFIQMDKALAQNSYGQDTEGEVNWGCCECFRTSCLQFWTHLLLMCPWQKKVTQGK
ncbi:MAG: hypothetical protein ABH827_06585 [bacterium]